MNSGHGPFLKYLQMSWVLLLFCLPFFGPISCAFPFSNLPPSPASQTAEAPVRDKEFDSLKGDAGLGSLETLSASETPTGPAGGNPAKPVGEQPVVRLFI